MNRTIGVLIKARRLLRKGWCQGAAARTKYGQACPGRSEHACEWCMDGSLWASCGPYSTELRASCERMILQANRLRDIVKSNDKPRTKKEDVIRWMTNAIKYAKRHAV
jgi:hypothetical protein